MLIPVLPPAPAAPAAARVVRVQAQLSHERSRDFDGPLEKLNRKNNVRRKDLEDQQVKMEELAEKEKVKLQELKSMANQLSSVYTNNVLS